MKHQQSILSFFQKRPTVPETEKPVPGVPPKGHTDTVSVSEKKLQPTPLAASKRPNILSSAVETSDEVKGTETPPEKEQRSFFPLKSVTGGEHDEANTNGQSMFANIRHKFMRPNSVQKPSDRYISLINLKFSILDVSTVITIRFN